MNPPKIESGQEYLLRVYIADKSENYLNIEVIGKDGESLPDNPIFCLSKTKEHYLIQQ